MRVVLLVGGQFFEPLAVAEVEGLLPLRLHHHGLGHRGAISLAEHATHDNERIILILTTQKTTTKEHSRPLPRTLPQVKNYQILPFFVGDYIPNDPVSEMEAYVLREGSRGISWTEWANNGLFLLPGSDVLLKIRSILEVGFHFLTIEFTLSSPCPPLIFTNGPFTVAENILRWEGLASGEVGRDCE